MTKETSLALLDLEIQSVINFQNENTLDTDSAFLDLLHVVRKDIESDNSSYQDFIDNLIEVFKETTDNKNQTSEQRKQIILETFETLKQKYDHTK